MRRPIHAFVVMLHSWVISLGLRTTKKSKTMKYNKLGVHASMRARGRPRRLVRSSGHRRAARAHVLSCSTSAGHLDLGSSRNLKNSPSHGFAVAWTNDPATPPSRPYVRTKLRVLGPVLRSHSTACTSTRDPAVTGKLVRYPCANHVRPRLSWPRLAGWWYVRTSRWWWWYVCGRTYVYCMSMYTTSYVKAACIATYGYAWCYGVPG
jgi:hypothetical protein